MGKERVGEVGGGLKITNMYDPLLNAIISLLNG
jgi:hypothetical protein